jgi:hypothetical protein
MKARVVFESAIKADPQDRLPTIEIDTPETGPVEMHHGHFVMVTEALARNGSRIALTVGFRGCPCGCKAPGTAFMFTPSPDHARAIAAQLIAIADDLDGRAKDQASDALRKASGK